MPEPAANVAPEGNVSNGVADSVLSGAGKLSRTVAVICLVASVVSLTAKSWWVADLIANLRVQLMIGLIVCLIGLLATRQIRWAIVVVIALVWHVSWIAPYLFAPSKPTGSPVLKVCTVNVLTQNFQYDKIVDMLKRTDADLIAVLELGSGLESRLREELGNTYPYDISESSDDGNFGIGLWSKRPLEDDRIFHLTVPLVPSVSATVDVDGERVRVIATHPIPPIGSRSFESRNRHLELLAKRLRPEDSESNRRATIVVGDLNLTPWSPWYGKFLADAELKDCIEGDWLQALTPTWYRWKAFPFGLVLDHGFCSADLRCSRRQVLEDIGSDHRPVLLEFIRGGDFSVQEVENLQKK
ncbi:MAG: endonuclease/exonuclease/phosphatase family protein [Planctomycetaceae bacterium]